MLLKNIPIKSFPIAPMPAAIATDAPLVALAAQVAPVAPAAAVGATAAPEAATVGSFVEKKIQAEEHGKMPPQLKRAQLDDEQLRVKDEVRSILGRFEHKKKVELLGRLADELLKEERNSRDPGRCFSESQSTAEAATMA